MSVNRAIPLPFGPTSLLVMQPIERCNLDCSYCYLPNRAKSGRMSLDTVRSSIEWLKAAGLVAEDLTILWHTGEPLLAGLAFFQSAHQIILHKLPEATRSRFSFQTNATVVNDEWAAFFRSTKSEVGVSIDGPREWHDARRRTLGGHGSWDKTMRGIECLRRHGVPFGTVTVLSEHALLDPERLYRFLCELGADTFGFNNEEVEGIHGVSNQYESASARHDAQGFYERLYNLASRDGSYQRVREIGKSIVAMRRLPASPEARAFPARLPSDVSDPFRIVSVSHNGDVSTFAPELAGHHVGGLGEFVFGNVHRDTFDQVAGSIKFQQANRLIASGVDQCRTSCSYYNLCGGGSPSNKVFENGRLDSTVTMFCQLSIMAPTDAVLSCLESEVARSH